MGPRLPDEGFGRLSRTLAAAPQESMAPEFSPGFAKAVVGIYLVYVAALVVTSTAAIYVLGRVAGRVFPPVRHVAPLAFGALAVWLSPVRPLKPAASCGCSRAVSGGTASPASPTCAWRARPSW